MIKYGLIGKNIKMLREKAKMSQAELAESICTQAQISRIENGEVIPLSTTLFEISKKLEIDMNQFFEMAYYHRFDYIKDVKHQLRKAMRYRDYKLVFEIVRSEKKNACFTPVEHQQLLIWHEGVSTYYVKRNFEQSMKLLLQALQLREKTSNTIYSMTEIGIFNSIGILHNEEKKFETSVESFMKALLELKKVQKNVDKMKLKIYFGLSKSLCSLERYKEAMKYCKEGLNICHKKESFYLLGEIHFQLAISYYHLRNKDRSLYHFNKASNVFDVVNNEVYKKIVTSNINEYFPNEHQEKVLMFSED